MRCERCCQRAKSLCGYEGQWICRKCEDFRRGISHKDHGLPYCDICGKPSRTVNYVGYGMVACPSCEKEFANA